MKTDPKFDVSVRVLQEEKNELEELALKHDLSLDRMSRVAPEVRRRAKEKARLEYRSLNNYIEFLVLKDLGMEIPVQTDEEIDISFE